MRKLISILVTLGVVLGLTLMAAVPVAAVSAPVVVVVDEPITGVSTNYTIMFHNGSLLLDGDFIDVMFPAGTNATGATVLIATAATQAALIASLPGAFGAATASASGDLYVRIEVPAAGIAKCSWVALYVMGVVNPLPCFHHLQVGSSTHTPVASLDYTIYSLKVCLDGGVGVKNLFAMPAYPEDEAIEVVLADLFEEAEDTAGDAVPFTFSVWYWDACDAEWIIYASDTSFDDLETIEPGKSYWIKVNYGICFYFKGVAYPDDQGPPAKFCWYCPCWNMVGVPSTVAINASDFLKNTLLPPFYTQYAVVAIYEWDGANYVDLGWNGQFGNEALLDADGEGYWMAFIEGACIIPPLP